MLLQHKKGILKGDWGGMTQIVTKVHDSSKETGKKANIFEQKAMEQHAEKLAEEQVKKQAAMKKIMKEEQLAEQKEKERKEKVAKGLAALQSKINTQQS